MRLSPGPAAVEKRGAEVDYQVAAPAEMRTPNLHRAKNRSTKSADGRMATEAARLERKKPTGRKQEKNRLDSIRPSHGRTYRAVKWPRSWVRRTGRENARGKM